MIVVRILGGLGNQMFQYAYAKSLQQKGYKVKIDISKFKTYKLHGGYQLDKYKIDLKTKNSIFDYLGFLKLKGTIKEKSLLFDKNLTEPKKNEFIRGYFQCEKYFHEIRAVLLKQFTINKKLSETTKNVENQINKTINSCSLHVRRGDYITNKKVYADVQGICDLEYYKRAINVLSKEHDNLIFFVFSNDILWAKNNLEAKNIVFVEQSSTPHEDMFLMSLCNHNIIANSSFSWWGAWLNQNENKTVIAPKLWFKKRSNEIACETWIQL